MSTDSELLIKIKTILESQGIDAAKAKLGELITTTNASSLSEANANKERDKTTAQAEKTAKAVMAMNTAMAGGLGPFRAAIAVANQLGGSFAMLAFKASAIGAAMTIGFKIGNFLGEWVTGAKEAEAEMDKITKAANDLRVYVTKLNDIKLDKLKAEAKSIADGFSTAVDKAERLKRLSDLREDSELATDLARVNLQFQKGKINENERDRLELKYQLESEQRKNKTEEKRINSEEATSVSTSSQAQKKMGMLSRQAGMAELKYNETIDKAKKLGISDPKLLLPDGDGNESGEYKKTVDDLNTEEKDIEDQRALLSHQKLGYTTPAKLKEKNDILDERATSLREKRKVVNALLRSNQNASGTKKALDQYRPEYESIAKSESAKQEQLETDKAVLVEKSKASSVKYQAGNVVIENKITSDYDKAVTDARPAREKARDSGKSIIDSLGLTPKTMTDNAGLPLSQGAQASYDEARMIAAKNAIAKATNASYRGGDVNAIVDELVKALDNVGARLVGTVHKDDLAPVLTAVKNLESQNSVNKGTN
jgi:hypothetical protein